MCMQPPSPLHCSLRLSTTIFNLKYIYYMGVVALMEEYHFYSVRHVMLLFVYFFVYIFDDLSLSYTLTFFIILVSDN